MLKVINNKNQLVDFYKYIKNLLIKKGYKNDINYSERIPPLDEMDKWFFFSEYCWVVINSGMKNQVAEKIFKAFWNNGKFNFNKINHPNKNNSIKKVYNRLDFIFEHFKTSENKLLYLKRLPHIGKITQFHLAKNLGLNYGKPDQHLVRIANTFGYEDVQEFCKYISECTGDKLPVVDTVFWRFANITDNYLELIKKWGHNQ